MNNNGAMGLIAAVGFAGMAGWVIIPLLSLGAWYYRGLPFFIAFWFCAFVLDGVWKFIGRLIGRVLTGVDVDEQGAVNSLEGRARTIGTTIIVAGLLGDLVLPYATLAALWRFSKIGLAGAP